MAKEDSESAANTFSALRKTKREPSHQEARVVQTAQGIADTTYNLSEIVHHATPEQAFRKENDSVRISKETQTLLARTMVKMYQSFEPLKLTAVPVAGLTGEALQNAYAQNAIVDFVKNFADAAKLEEGAAATPVDLRTEAGLTDHAIYLLTTSPHKAQWLMTAFTLSQWEQMTLQMALRAELQYVSKYPKEIDNTRSVGVTTSQGSSQHEFGFSDIRLGRNMVPMTFEALKTAKMKLGKTKYGGYLFGKSDAQSRQVIFYEPDRSTYLADKSNVKIDYSNPNLNDTQRRFLLQHFRGTLIDPNNLRNGATFSDMPVGGSPKDPGGIKQREIDHLLQLAAARDEVYRMTGVNIGQAPDLIQRTGTVFGRGPLATDTLAFRHESFEPGSKNVVSIEQQANAAMTGVKTKLDELREQKKATGAVTSAKSVVDSRLAQREVKWKKVSDKDEIVEEAEQHDQFDIDYVLSESELRTKARLERELQQLKERKGYAEERKDMVEDLANLKAMQESFIEEYKNDPKVQAERPGRIDELGKEKTKCESDIRTLEQKNQELLDKIGGGNAKTSDVGRVVAVEYQERFDQIKTKQQRLAELTEDLDRLILEEKNGIFQAKYIPKAKELVDTIAKKEKALTEFDATHGDVRPAVTGSSTPLGVLRSVAEYEKDILAKEKQLRKLGPDAYWKEYKKGAYQSAQTLFTGERQLDIIKAAKKLETADDKAAVVKVMLDVRDPRYKDYPPAYLITLQMLYGEDIIGPNKFEDFNKAVVLLPPDKWLGVVGPALSIPGGDIFHTNTALFANASAEHINYASIRSVLDALVTEVKTSDRFGLPDETVEMWCESMREIAYAELDFTQPPFKQIIEGLLRNPDLYYFINEDHLALLIFAVQNDEGDLVSAEEAKTLAREYMRRKKVTGLVTLNKMPPSSATSGTSASTSSPPPSAPPPGGAGAAATPPGTGSPASSSTTPPPPVAPAPSRRASAFTGATIDVDPGIDILRLTSVISAAESLASDNHPGQNHDRVVNKRDSGLYAVFDGAGGAGGDPEAAAIAASKAVEEYDAANPFDASKTSVDEYFKGMLQDANVRVAAEGEKGTTTASIVKVFETPSGLEAGIIHRGDSRVYLIRNGKLTQLTEDHSILGYGLPFVKGQIEAVLSRDKVPYNKQDIDKLTEDNIKNRFERFDHLSQGGGFTDDIDKAVFELRNWISSFIDGSNRSVKTFTSTFNVEKGDQLLITCDGVHDNLTYDEISAIMNDRTLTADQKAKKLTGDAHARSQDNTIRSKPDDISAVVVAV